MSEENDVIKNETACVSKAEAIETDSAILIIKQLEFIRNLANPQLARDINKVIHIIYGLDWTN